MTTRKTNVLPGFGLTLGLTLAMLGVVVLLPLAALVWKGLGLGLEGMLEVLSQPRVRAAFGLSFGAALAAGAINALFGLLAAWVLVRYEFPGRRLLDAIVDLPFALPTAVAGIALTALYVPEGWLGRWLEPLGVRVAFTRLGVIVALTFVGLPFVVRTLQPVLQDLDQEVEEAAASLGATRWQTFRRVILPALLPAWLTGFTLAFARAVGEYGSVVFIAGNLPGETEIAPLVIMTRLEQFDYAGATAVGSAMLGVSLVLLLLINGLQARMRARLEG
jgi:sulfate transport system permease protein